MDILSIKEMVAREEEAFRSGISAAALMEAAGAAMAERIESIYPRAKNFLVLVGKGNNGGDGVVVARHLAKPGHCVEVVLAAPEDQLGELPVAQLAKLRQAAPDVEVMPWSDEIVFPYSGDLVIDALLGVQASGPLRGNLKEIVAAMNAARAARFFRTVALDLPSGLAAFEQSPAPEDHNAAVIADVTMAVGFPKRVLAREALAGWVGRIEVVPWSSGPENASNYQVLVPNEVAGLLPRRGALSYKGDFGKLAIVAGSPGFTGAPILCLHGAQAAGAGLLSIVTHAEAAPIVAAQAPPEAMVSGWENIDETPKVIENASAIVIGPGLGTSAESKKMLEAVLRVDCPVLIDADGLNLLAQDLALLKHAKGPLVLTPHIGEMGRLIGRKFRADERESVARFFVETHKITLVLKGTRTLVAAPGPGRFIGDHKSVPDEAKPVAEDFVGSPSKLFLEGIRTGIFESGFSLFINTTGNPGLSTGGSGDTLSGIIGALLAQKVAPPDAARLGVWLHGHAADLVLAARDTEEGLTPSMLSDHVGAALESLRFQAAPRPGLLECARSVT